MKTSVKISIVAVMAGLLIGCLLGFFLPSVKVTVTADSAKGDITKVSKFNRNVVSPAMSAFQERVTGNPEEMKKARATLTVLTSRMVEFDELVTVATVAAEGREELASSLKELQKVKQLAANARANGLQALEALDAISEGKKPSCDYEQAARNLSLAFLMVDRQTNVGKRFVNEADAYLRGRDINDCRDLAFARDLWAGYCTGEAVLNDDKEEMAYWNGKKDILATDTEALGMLWDQFPQESLNYLIQCTEIDESLGLGIVSGVNTYFAILTIAQVYVYDGQARLALFNKVNLKSVQELEKIAIVNNFSELMEQNCLLSGTESYGERNLNSSNWK